MAELSAYSWHGKNVDQDGSYWALDSWLMHLQAVSNCLTVFAAAGHFNYLPSAHYYLQ